MRYAPYARRTCRTISTTSPAGRANAATHCTGCAWTPVLHEPWRRQAAPQCPLCRRPAEADAGTAEANAGTADADGGTAAADADTEDETRDPLPQHFTLYTDTEDDDGQGNDAQINQGCSAQGAPLAAAAPTQLAPPVLVASAAQRLTYELNRLEMAPSH